jgi:hypothetical protein
MKDKKLLWMLLASIIISPVFVPGQQFSDADLIRLGNQAWQQLRCVQAGEYLFAYLQHNPPEVQANRAYGDKLRQAIQWCEQNATISADSKGDSPGRGSGRGAVQPQISLTPPPAQNASSAQKRCNVYATLAVAQQGVNTSNRCGYSGTRWVADYNFHYQYCLGAPVNDVVSETQTRQNLLFQCAQ